MYDALVSAGAMLFVIVFGFVLRFLFRILEKKSSQFTAWGLSSHERVAKDAQHIENEEKK